MNKYVLVTVASLAGIIASVDVTSAMPVAPSSPDNIVIQNVDWHHRDYRYHNYHGGYRGRYRDQPYGYRYGYYHHRHHGPVSRLIYHL